jgi:hypothetical protein
VPAKRTFVLSLKIRESTAEALTTAAKKHDRSKASLAEAVLEQWQREEGFLK